MDQLLDLGDVPAGLWVVVEIGIIVTMSKLGENEDGDPCTIFQTVTVTR